MATTAPPPLPTRDGVSHSCVALPGSGHWPSMLAFLLQRFPDVTEAEWRQRMDDGLVVDQQGQPVTPARPFERQQKLYYYRRLETEPAIPFAHQILFQDEHLVAVDKPHFLPVIPSGRFLHETLLVRLKKELGCDTLAPLHRLDRETAGVVLFGVRPQERGAYQALLRERQVHKRYEAVACAPEALLAQLQFPLTRRSRIDEDGERFFRQREVDGEPNSETHIRLLESRDGLARFELEPVTGKTHQLRVHMAALGLPILNDLYYPDVVHARDALDQEDQSKPLKLLAKAIAFTDPVTGQARSFESRRGL